MKNCLFAIVIMLALPIYGQKESPEPNSNEGHAQEAKKPNPAPSPIPADAPIVINQETTNTQNNGAESHTKGYLSRLLAPENLPNVGLFVIGFGGIIIAICSLRKIERQIATAERSVTTGVRQFAAENRPWILIPWGDDSAKIGEPHLIPAESVSQKEKRRTHCMFPVRNYGRSPARVISEKAQLQIGPSGAIVPDITAYELGGADHNDFIFAHTATIYAEAELFPGTFITPEQKSAIDGGTSFLWLCGFLRYKDSLGIDETPEFKPIEYETRFCYLWETRTNAPKPYWRMAGPAQYNRAT
jgi:hypothetical protein